MSIEPRSEPSASLHQSPRSRRPSAHRALRRVARWVGQWLGLATPGTSGTTPVALPLRTRVRVIDGLAAHVGRFGYVVRVLDDLRSVHMDPDGLPFANDWMTFPVAHLELVPLTVLTDRCLPRGSEDTAERWCTPGRPCAIHATPLLPDDTRSGIPKDSRVPGWAWLVLYTAIVAGAVGGWIASCVR